MSMNAVASLTVHTAAINTPARRRQLIRWMEQNRKVLKKYSKSIGPVLTSQLLVPKEIPLRSARAEKY